MRYRHRYWLSLISAFIAASPIHPSLSYSPVMCDARPSRVGAVDFVQEQLPDAEIKAKLDLIGAACMNLKQLSCSVIERGMVGVSRPTIGRMVLRLSPDGVAQLADIATTGAKIIKRDSGIPDHQKEADKIKADLAENAANGQRINGLLSGEKITVDQRIDLESELTTVEEQYVLLKMRGAALRERSASLVVQIEAAPL